MSTDTVLTDEQIVGFAYKRDGQPEVTLMRLFARDVEQAILQSEKVQAWKRDAERLDWLADPNNSIGNVQLPTKCVTENPHCLRAAIDAAMEKQT